MRLLAAAFGTVLGLQCLRALFPLLVYVLKDRAGLGSPALGGIGLVLFASAFVLPAVAARLGASALPRIALALAITRAALQAWNGDPAVSLALAGIGVVAFLGLLAAMTRVPSESEPPVTAFLLGALIDTAVHALFGTRDLHWGGTAASPTAGVLIGLAVATAWNARGRALEIPQNALARPRGAALLAFGPYLYLHLEQLGNVARFSARAGSETAVSGTVVAGGLALGLVLARAVPRRGAFSGAGAVLIGAALLARALLWSEAPGPVAVTLVLAQIGAAVLLARALTPKPDPVPAPGEVPGAGRGGAASFGGGFLLLLVFFFAHYAGYDLPLPFGREAILLGAAFALTLGALSGAADARQGAPAAVFVTAVTALLIAGTPMLRPALFPPAAPPAPDHPVLTRVVSLNLHQGFDERGGWSFDRQMRALREASPDIIALQEVSRGWVINGGADLWELARESLGFAGAPAPSVHHDWGNAILARHALDDFGIAHLPPRSLPIPRAVGIADARIAGGQRLRILATHLHHPEADREIREHQAIFLAHVEVPETSQGAVLLGDFNALPESRSLRILRDAGWTDVYWESLLSEAPDEGATFPSRDPARRIDTIFVRGPWRVASTGVFPPWGSDHRAVWADLQPR